MQVDKFYPKILVHYGKTDIATKKSKLDLSATQYNINSEVGPATWAFFWLITKPVRM